MSSTSRRFFSPATLSLAAVAIAATFLPWEGGGESWGYWYFAKQLIGGGGFVTGDRSPLYTLYLVPFLAAPYPFSTVLEGAVTAFICALAVFYFLRPLVGQQKALLFSALWLPFFQQMEPTNQALALACVCTAFGLRHASGEVDSHGRKNLSYALIIAATLFRPNFVVFLVFLVAHDALVVYRSAGTWKQALSSTVRPLAGKATFAMVALALLFSVFQSGHRWNNVWLGSTDWFPQSTQSLGATSVIGHFNWRYIESKYGSFEGRDIYFTNQEAFGGATTVAGMIRSNPKLFGEILVTNIKAFFHIAAFNFTIPALPVPKMQGLLSLLAFAALCVGAFKGAKDPLPRIFGCASLIIVVVTSLSFPKVRYMNPLVPAIAISAVWYAGRLEAAMRRLGIRSRHAVAAAGAATVLLFSLAPVKSWLELAHPPESLFISAAHSELQVAATDCRGIITLEHLFFGAFVVDEKKARVYDIWAQPPFGRYPEQGQSELNPKVIDCVFISKAMEETVGMGTNVKLRYDNYIRPYAEHLLAEGGSEQAIANYGRVVKARRV